MTQEPDNRPEPCTWRALALNLLLGLLVLVMVDRGGDWALRQGLDRYFGLDREGAVVLVGHSHMVLGVDPVGLEGALGVPVAPYTRAGALLEDRILMARHYSELHPEGPRMIVFGVDGHLFAPEGLSANSYQNFYPYFDDPLIRDYIDRKANSREELITHRLFHLTRYNDVLLNGALRGWRGDWSNSVTGRFEPASLARQVERGSYRRIAIDPGQVAMFEDFLAQSEAAGVPVVLAFIPTSAQWNAIQPAEFARVIALFEQFAASHANVTYIDLRQSLENRTELFVDPVHLNANGRALVSDALARRLAPLLERTRNAR